MKRVGVVLLVLSLFVVFANVAYAATNQDALAGLIQTLNAIGKLADEMVKAYMEYLKA